MSKRRQPYVKLKYANGVNLGTLQREVDGYWYWYPPQTTGGAWSQEIMQSIVDRMTKLNAEWDAVVKESLTENPDKQRFV